MVLGGDGIAESEQSGSAAARLMWLLPVTGTIAALILSVLAARTISRPLGDVVDVLARVAPVT